MKNSERCPLTPGLLISDFAANVTFMLLDLRGSQRMHHTAVCRTCSRSVGAPTRCMMCTRLLRMCMLLTPHPGAWTSSLGCPI